MESFQQSLLNTSLPSRLNLDNQTHGLSSEVDDCWPSGWYWGAYESSLEKATTSEMEPLRSSVIRTAAAAEYVRDGAADTRE